MKALLKYLAIITLAWGGTICFAADSSAARQKIIIAIIPETNLIKQMERFAPLCHYLEVKTGLEVDVRPMSNYGQLYEEMRDGNIDAGFFGSFLYVLTRTRIGIEPLVRPVDRSERSTYSGLTFVRKDSGIRSPADMKGKTIALVDPSTTAGYLSQKEYLKNNGIDIDKDLTIFWTGSHDAAVNAVLLGQAEIGGAKDTIVRRFQKANRVFDSTAVIVDETPRKGVPNNTFAVRKGLDRKISAKLKRTFLEMRSDPYGKRVLATFGATRFVSTSDDDYKSLYNLVSHLNLDLQTYPYKRDLQPSRSRRTGE